MASLRKVILFLLTMVALLENLAGIAMNSRDESSFIRLQLRDFLCSQFRNPK